MRTTVTIITIIALIAIVWFLFGTIDGGDNGVSVDGVSIEQEFEGKIVYTTDLSVDKEPLRAHCSAQRGEFNDCGSVCEPDAEMCASVCAYTCELGN